MTKRWKKIAIALTALVFLGGLAAVGSLAGLFWIHGRELDELDGARLRAYRPPQITRIYARDGESLIGEIFSERRTFVSIESIPVSVREAFLAAEDADFYHHHGLDYWGMTRALVANVRAGRLTQGASTITQQVIKNFLLSPERTLKRKVQELVLARRVEDTLGKDKILELYLNGIYFGHGAYGIEEAARLYFGVSVQELDLGQAALLAALPKAPGSSTPYKNPKRAKERQVYVLRQLVAKGFVKEGAVEGHIQAPLNVVPLSESRAVERGAEEFVDAIRMFLREKYGEEALDRLGARVVATVDLPLQRFARESVLSSLRELDVRQAYGRATKAQTPARQAEILKEVGQPKANQVYPAVVDELPVGINAKSPGIAVRMGTVRVFVPVAEGSRYDDEKLSLAAQFVSGGVTMVKARPASSSDGLPSEWWIGELASGPEAAFAIADVASGEILAMIGGSAYESGALNRFTSARRQPGSSFKPFVYGAALASKKFSAATLVSDSPQIYEKWRPTNYESDVYRGDIRLRTALTRSVNTVAIKLADEIGPPAIIDFAKQAGIESELRPDLSLALGTSEVTPFELLRGYLTLARGGERSDLQLVASITTPDGEEWRPEVVSQRVFDQDSVFVLTSLMQSVTRSGTAAALAKLGIPLAGKTGTSAEVRDAWFAGFSRDYVGVAWVGHDLPKPLGRKESGGRSALPIFSRVFAEVHKGKVVPGFVPPAGVTIRTIDAKTGLLASSEALDNAKISPSPDIEEGFFEEYFVAGTEPKDFAPLTGESAQDTVLDLYDEAADADLAPDTAGD
jgi:penicillin-binding protein 1A